jgi:uncharacterized protein
VPRFDRVPGADGPLVQAIGPKGFTVDGGIYPGLLLTPVRAEGWSPPPLADLMVADLEPLLRLEPAPEFILLGTGTTMAFAPRPLVSALEARGIGVEAMDSRAGARTWGVLRAEGRWIAAALMPL